MRRGELVMPFSFAFKSPPSFYGIRK